MLLREYPWDQYLWKGRGNRIGQRRNLTGMWTSSFSQHLKEALELKWFIRDSPCCIKMAKWLCVCFYGFFNLGLNQSLSVDHPQKGMTLARGCLVCSWGDSRRTNSSRLWATNPASWKEDLHVHHTFWIPLSLSLSYTSLSFIQQIVCVGCARHSLKCWEFKNEQNKVLVLKGKHSRKEEGE